jgi:hypothetical protein
MLDRPRLMIMRLASVLSLLIALQLTPAAAADCSWSNGVYRCPDRSGRTSAAKPRLQRPPPQQPRRSQDAMRERTPYPRDFGTGMGAFSYGCTMSRCD